MPRFDGTGLRGQVPMSGRGMGYCITPVNNKAVPRYLQFRNRGRGMGVGNGLGRGMGRLYRQRINNELV